MKNVNEARMMFLRILHLSAPFYFIWLDYHIFTTAFSVVMVYWDSLGFPIVMLGIQLFTVWAQALQQIYYFSIAWKEVRCLLERKPYCDSAKSAGNMEQVYFTSVVFPTSTVVVVNFWTIYTLDPLLLDDLNVISVYTPPWLNHCLHTNVFIIVFVETILNSKLVFLDDDWNSMAASKVIIVYSIFIGILGKVCPRCVYPFFNILETWQKLLYLLANFAIVIAAYETSKKLHRIIWGKKGDTVQETSELR